MQTEFQAAMLQAASVARSAIRKVANEVRGQESSYTLYPVPKHIQVARFRAHTNDSLLHIYKQRGEVGFNSYVQAMMDLMDEGY